MTDEDDWLKKIMANAELKSNVNDDDDNDMLKDLFENWDKHFFHSIFVSICCFC